MAQGKRVYQTGQLDYAQRKAICLKKRASPKITQEQLRVWAQSEFALVKAPGQSTISDILKNADAILALDARALESKRIRSVAFPELDLALANWVVQCEARNVRIYNDLIKAQAGVFCALLSIAPHEMRFSGGWLESFKDRHGFNGFKAFGKATKAAKTSAAATAMAAGTVEQAGVPAPVTDGAAEAVDGATGGGPLAIASATLATVAVDRVQEIRERIASYSVQDVYAMQETGLFFKIEPDASKRHTARVTVALCTNSDGSDKREPLIIGMHKQPASFRDKTAEQHGFYYRSNKRSWMTGLLFRDWISRFNTKMSAEGRKVLLLLDRATTHVVTGLKFLNVEVQFLPANSTLKLQPFDAGIMRAFKLKYRVLHLQHALEQAEELQRWTHEGKPHPQTPTNIYGISQLTAMRWICATWKDVSDETILNCFQAHNLFQERIKTRQSVNQIERELEAALLYKMDFLRVYDPLLDSKVLMTEEEENSLPVHQTFNPEDFVDKLSPAEEAENQLILETASVLDSYTVAQKLDRVRAVILMLNDFAGAEEKTISTLRDLQKHLRDQAPYEDV
ncbi:Cenpb protein homeodomainlike [Globisporangium polare]